ncbi:hypothetical protein EHI8A_005260 [Entamoeba histolytica HM-1:IMSS-B]|uniref:URB1 C-terminal domain-containing protein n=5 Tax=Entamoeba histolytica TaxID=5759 RepID=C4LZ34_ENTH1|nr:hypothetical protein EHI_009600 [Entamoeba histolytica HM-1:IMSS]EMD42802.1 Hypothetical protein EHI5A_025000 [Entamoeba histolytica KU27]EMH74760.1 hypothetical protein EHI8A_005260 [Entamoeba histolytica HM-1:IMSS-B]ENY62272.1 hypothetical protein EHI7A_007940 [Entamoeba histolytica HM-1:IMSS-A]GAT94107.1 hypothetical protein CL6EHI_009600 [Entamoeba histolytica]EAL49285.2 hypothetical protein EHI_009600 [Entamoeba histolytica HM-1:IMSS]|eukprot:XP_654673.2 hypothetical protein EHI_009600 [Entamoeba histolytica HM-1:IMSS]
MQNQLVFARLLNEDSSIVNSALDELIEYIQKYKNHENDGSMIRYYLKHSPRCNELVDTFKMNANGTPGFIQEKAINVLIEIFSMNLEEEKEVLQTTVSYLFGELLTNFMKWLSSSRLHSRIACLRLIIFLLRKDIKMFKFVYAKVGITYPIWKDIFNVASKREISDFREVIVEFIDVLSDGCNSKFALTYLNDYLTTANPLSLFILDAINDTEDIQTKLLQALIKMLKSPYLKDKQFSFFFKKNILTTLYNMFIEPQPIPLLKEFLYMIYTIPGYITPLIPTNKPIHYNTLVNGMENFYMYHKETRKLMISIFKNQPAIVAQMYLSSKNFGFNFTNDLPTYIQTSFLLEMLNTMKLPVNTLNISSYDFIKGCLIFIPKTAISKLASFNKLFKYQAALILFAMASRTEVYAQSTHADQILMDSICQEFPDAHSIYALATSQSSNFAFIKCLQTLEILHRVSPTVFHHSTLRMEQVVLRSLESSNELVLYRGLHFAAELGESINWISNITSSSISKKQFPAMIIPISLRVNELIKDFPLLRDEYNKILDQIIFKYSPYESFIFRSNLGNDISSILKFSKATHSKTLKSVVDSRNCYKKMPAQYDLPALFHFILLGHQIGIGKTNEEKCMVIYYQTLLNDEETEMPVDRKNTLISLMKESKGFQRIQLLLCCFRLRHEMIFDEEVKQYLRDKYQVKQIDDGDVIYHLKEEIKELISQIEYREFSIESDVIDSHVTNILLQLNHTRKLFDSNVYKVMANNLIELLLIFSSKKKMSKELLETISKTIIPFFNPFLTIENYYITLSKLFLYCNNTNLTPSNILIETLFNITKKTVIKKIIYNKYFGSYLSKMKINKCVMKTYLLLIKLLPHSQEQLLKVYENKSFIQKLKIGLLKLKNYKYLFEWYWKGIWNEEKEQTLQIIAYLSQNKKEFVQSVVLHNCPIKRIDSFENISKDILIPVNLMIYSINNKTPLSINFVLSKCNQNIQEEETSLYLNLLLEESIRSNKHEWITLTLEQIHVVLNTQKVFINPLIFNQLKEYIAHCEEPTLSFIKEYTRIYYPIEESLDITKHTIFNTLVALITKDCSFLGDKSQVIFKQIIEQVKNFTLQENEYYKELIHICCCIIKYVNYNVLLSNEEWINLIIDTIQSTRYGYGIVSLLLTVIENKDIQLEVLLKIQEKSFKPKWELPITHDFSVLLIKLYGQKSENNPTFDMMKMIYESYNGTMSNTDRMIFYLIIQYSPLYPKLPLVAGRHGLDYKTSINRMFDNTIFFNKKDMEYSLSHFPFSRKSNEEDLSVLIQTQDTEEEYPYDPCYLLPLTYHTLDRAIVFKKYIFQPRSYIYNGFLSFAMIATAAEDENIRKMGYSILQKTLYILKIKTTFYSFCQRSFIQAFLFIFRNSIDTANQQISAPTAILYSKMIMVVVQQVNPLWKVVSSYLFKRNECKIALNPFNFMNRLEEYPSTATILLLESLAESTSFYHSLPNSFKSRKVYETILAEISNPHTFYSDSRPSLVLLNKMIQKWGITDSCIFYFVQLLQGRNAIKLTPIIIESIKYIVSFNSFIETTKNQIPLSIIIIFLLKQCTCSNELSEENALNMKDILQSLSLSSSSIPPIFSVCSMEIQDQLISLCYSFEQKTKNIHNWFIWN